MNAVKNACWRGICCSKESCDEKKLGREVVLRKAAVNLLRKLSGESCYGRVLVRCNVPFLALDSPIRSDAASLNDTAPPRNNVQQGIFHFENSMSCMLSDSCFSKWIRIYENYFSSRSLDYCIVVLLKYPFLRRRKKWPSFFPAPEQRIHVPSAPGWTTQLLSGAGKRSSKVIPAPETSSQASFRRRKTGSLYLPAPESNSLNSFRRRRRQSMYLEISQPSFFPAPEDRISLSGLKKGSILSHRLYGSGNGKWHSLHITSCSSCSISNFSRVCRLEDGEAIFFVRIQNSYLPLLKTALNKAYLVMLSMQEKKLAVS